MGSGCSWSSLQPPARVQERSGGTDQVAIVGGLQEDVRGAAGGWDRRGSDGQSPQIDRGGGCRGADMSVDRVWDGQGSDGQTPLDVEGGHQGAGLGSTCGVGEQGRAWGGCHQRAGPGVTCGGGEQGSDGQTPQVYQGQGFQGTVSGAAGSCGGQGRGGQTRQLEMRGIYQGAGPGASLDGGGHPTFGGSGSTASEIVGDDGGEEVSHVGGGHSGETMQYLKERCLICEKKIEEKFTKHNSVEALAADIEVVYRYRKLNYDQSSSSIYILGWMLQIFLSIFPYKCIRSVEELL